jgi:hypothetical protein
MASRLLSRIAYKKGTFPQHETFDSQRRNQQHLIKIEESLTVHRLNYKTNGTQEQKK